MQTIPTSHAPRVSRGILLWAPGIAIVFLYPFFIALFSHVLPDAVSRGESGSVVLAIFTTLAVFAPTLIALSRLNAPELNEPDKLRERALLNLLVVLPPLNTLVFLVAYLSELLNYTNLIWLALSVLLLAGIFRLQVKAPPQPHSPAFRVAHGVAALMFVGGFFLLHWANHVVAAWSPAAHGPVQETLRLWYRSVWVEPVLLALCVFLVGSGLYMTGRYLRRRTDRFTRWQTASGSYLGLFFCAHLLAVLSTRAGGGDTDWTFATGENGLIYSVQFLIPYYALALVSFSLHAGMGLRQILLAHTGTARYASPLARTASTLGYLVTLVTMFAALGFSIQSGSI